MPIDKIRSDKSTSVFNCLKKMKATFTAFNTFKKRRTRGFRETTERIPFDIIKYEIALVSMTI